MSNLQQTLHDFITDKIDAKELKRYTTANQDAIIDQLLQTKDNTLLFHLIDRFYPGVDDTTKLRQLICDYLNIDSNTIMTQSPDTDMEAHQIALDIDSIDIETHAENIRADVYQGITIDFSFSEKSKRAYFGDLLELCHTATASYNRGYAYTFDDWPTLALSQIDDYFGFILDDDNESIIWLYPISNHQVVDHSNGPFDGIRLEYNVLQLPINSKKVFLAIITALHDLFSFSEKKQTEALDSIINQIHTIGLQHGIEPGSDVTL